MREETGLAAERMTHLTTILTTPELLHGKNRHLSGAGAFPGKPIRTKTSFWASSACRWKKRLSGSCAAKSTTARRSAA
ncbi:MAG: hypothetical protein ACLUHE_15335 [Christensenellales bacterium]